MVERAVLFVDGNNWYHSLKNAGVFDQGRLDYAKISRKLVGARSWVATHYYVGQLKQEDDTKLYADQRAFAARLMATDGRISMHFGRIEHRPVEDRTGAELLRYLASLKIRLDPNVYHDLIAIGRKRTVQGVRVEKAVDVMLAVDLVVMAERDEYDVAYILSADGDFTPAVAAARASGKNVFAASPSMGAELAATVNSYIRLVPDWFKDCY